MNRPGVRGIFTAGLDESGLMTTFFAVGVSSARLRALPPPAIRWAAIFCALTIWVLGVLAISPQLHAALHSDADHQDHTCAVTLFNHGVDDGTTQTALAIEPLVCLEDVVTRPAARLVAAPRYWLLPGRAPPVR